MKKTDLVKSLGKKIQGQMHHAPIPGRFGVASDALPDRREQRKLDQAAGLVPFAVKLHNELVKRLNDRAAEEGVGVQELTARLLQAGLDGGETVATKAPIKKAAAGPAGADAPAKDVAVKAEPKKTAAKKVAVEAAKKVAAKASEKVATKTAVTAKSTKAAKPRKD